jgi:hypothetical protein
VSPLRRIWLQLKHCVTPYRELRRPSFPVDAKLTVTRGRVDDVKAVRRPKVRQVTSWPVDANGSAVE